MTADAEPALEIRPIPGPLRASPSLPGSKSLTNRALIIAALAGGESVSGVHQGEPAAHDQRRGNPCRLYRLAGAMDPTVPLTARRWRTPRAAAIAGILFSGLLMATMLLFLSAVPRDALEQGAWLAAGLERVVLAINLMPFAGVAFLWFIGVVRDRLADAEDRLFATVFLGSGLLFLAMMFVAAAVFGDGHRPCGAAR